MFIRIIKNDLEGNGNTREILNQCERVTIENGKDEGKGEKSTVFFTLDDDKRFELTKFNHEVYIMNDDGKTIERIN